MQSPHPANGPPRARTGRAATALYRARARALASACAHGTSPITRVRPRQRRRLSMGPARAGRRRGGALGAVTLSRSIRSTRSASVARSALRRTLEENVRPTMLPFDRLVRASRSRLLPFVVGPNDRAGRLLSSICCLSHRCAATATATAATTAATSLQQQLLPQQLLQQQLLCAQAYFAWLAPSCASAATTAADGAAASAGAAT